MPCLLNRNYYTVPGSESNIRVIHCHKEKTWGQDRALTLEMSMSADFVYMYKKLQFHNHQNLGFEQLKRARSTKQSLIRKLLLDQDSIRGRCGCTGIFSSPTGKDAMARSNHFDGLVYALKNAALMVTMTEKEDIGAGRFHECPRSFQALTRGRFPSIFMTIM